MVDVCETAQSVVSKGGYAVLHARPVLSCKPQDARGFPSRCGSMSRLARRDLWGLYGDQEQDENAESGALERVGGRLRLPRPRGRMTDQERFDSQPETEYNAHTMLPGVPRSIGGRRMSGVLGKRAGRS